MLQSSNLIFERYLKEDGSFVSYYCRSTNAKRIELETKIVTDYYQINSQYYASSIHSSGMNAIVSAFEAILYKYRKTNEITFVISYECYKDVYRTCEYLLLKYAKQGLKIIYLTKNCFNESSNEVIEIFKTHKHKIKMFFFETCSNPSGKQLNWNQLIECKSIVPECTFILDNTWTTAYGCNPFKHHVNLIDLVVESMSKFISASTCIGGLCCGKKQIINIITNYNKVYGTYIASDHCEIFLNGLRTLEKRMLESSKQTKLLLENIDKIIEDFPSFTVTRVFHPFLQNPQNHNLLLEPSLFLFHISHPVFNEKVNDRVVVVQQIQDYFGISENFETSYGSHKTQICNYPTFKSDSAYDLLECNSNNYGIWFRVAVGYESTLEMNLILLKAFVSGLHTLFCRPN